MGAVDPVVAEQHRIERIVSGLQIGETTVINGTEVTAIDLETADLLERRTVVTPELVDLPPLPVDPAARRRALRVRGW